MGVLVLLTFEGGGGGVVQNTESPDFRSPEVGRYAIVSVSIITPARSPINFKCKLVGKHKGIQKVLEESPRGLEVWRKWRDLNLTERKKRFPSWAGAEKICS